MIFPVPVTLKRFLALEFVFTLGILPSINYDTLEVFLHRQNPYWTSSVIPRFVRMSIAIPGEARDVFFKRSAKIQQESFPTKQGVKEKGRPLFRAFLSVLLSTESP
jgi:hypothetical protein